MIVDANCWLIVALSRPLSDDFGALLHALVDHYAGGSLAQSLGADVHESLTRTIDQCRAKGYSQPLVALFCVMLEFDLSLRARCSAQLGQSYGTPADHRTLFEYICHETHALRMSAMSGRNSATPGPRQLDIEECLFDAYEHGLRGTILSRDLSGMRNSIATRLEAAQKTIDSSRKQRRAKANPAKASFGDIGNVEDLNWEDDEGADAGDGEEDKEKDKTARSKTSSKAKRAAIAAVDIDTLASMPGMEGLIHME